MHDTGKKRIYKPKILRSLPPAPSFSPEKNAGVLAKLQERILELTASLPGELHLDRVYFKRNKNRTTLTMYEPLFYTEMIDVALTYYPGERVGNKSGLSVDTQFQLTVDVFSDKELQEEFVKFAKAHPREAQHLAATSYFFDAKGHFTKVTRLPEEMKLNRKVVFDYEFEKDYLSEMTAEDFILAERALTFLTQQLEDYLKWSKVSLLDLAVVNEKF